MSTDPTPPPAARPLVEFVAGNRSAVAWGLALVAVVCLGVGGYFVYSLWATAAGPAADGKEGGPPPVPALTDAARNARYIGAVGGFVGGLTAAVLAAGLAVRLPNPSPAGRLTDARTTILAAGGLLGLVLMLAGAALLFIPWFEPLSRWVADKTPPRDAWKPLVAVLVTLAGAGLAFLAAQPARAEERNNPFLRRLVYGSNVALTALLLALVLVVGNVFVGLRVPNKLDTTASGFYTLSDETRRYLAELSEPVKLYVTFPEDEDRLSTDVRRLATAVHEANPGKVQVRFLSPTLNSRELKSLRARFPQADLTADFGVLLTAGEDEKNYTFIPGRDFLKQDADPGTGSRTLAFQGEEKLIREVLFLAENKSRAVVYFTTGHGELAVAAGPGGDPQATSRPATRLRLALEKGYVDVRPLAFDRAAPKVPDDAAVVCVADPQAPLPANQVAALKAYLTEPRPGGKRGKLVVLAGPVPKPGGGVVDIGLGDLLAGLGVRLGGQFLYTEPMESLGFTDVQGLVGRAAVQARNPIALEFRPPRAVVFANCQEVASVPSPAGGGPTAIPLFLTFPEDRTTWFEPDPVANPGKALADLLQNRELARAKRAANTVSRPVAAAVAEGEVGRAVVYGSGDAFADGDGRQARLTENNAELFAVTVNWLRDRPTVANIAAKPYGMYEFSRGADSVRLILLPWGAALLGVLALGLGVWVFRRK